MDRLMQAAGWANLLQRGTPADGNQGPSLKGFFDSGAHPQSDRKGKGMGWVPGVF